MNIAIDGYSFERYGKIVWDECTMWLLESFTPQQTEVILRSKWMRWAADSTDSGSASFQGFISYLSRRTVCDLCELFLTEEEQGWPW